MSIGKYVTNLSVISSVAGAYSVVKQTRDMPQDWRRYLSWGIWAASVALAIAHVAKQDVDARYEQERKSRR